MSMPTFPEHIGDITEDQALTMIIASVAMEELALSHIINAEGEKLQYILGTLPGNHATSTSTKELLEVNKSVGGLLEIVMQNQMLLKSKLEKVLEARGPCCPRKCCEEECDKSRIRLCCSCCRLLGNCCCNIPFHCCGLFGESIRWDENRPDKVCLKTGRRYLLNYNFNLRPECHCPKPGSIGIYSEPKCAFAEVPPRWFALEGPTTVGGSTVLYPTNCCEEWAELELCIHYPNPLLIEAGELCILEV